MKRFVGVSWRALALGLAASAAAGAAAAGPALPTGGHVAAGGATVGAAAGGELTISQSSSRAIIDWTSFSIGQGGSVDFQNGTGATLNRVSGGEVSSLDGSLAATGSVYLINPAGVVIGKDGVVNVGGGFVASSLDVDNAAFLAGGALSFSGAGQGQVVNLGKVGALGGDVALIGPVVSNAGEIDAPNGEAALAAGRAVLLRDASLDGGRFAVLVGGAGTSATNSGAIAAANAALLASGGNVYALAGNTDGVIKATAVSAGQGQVWLLAGEAGTVSLEGGQISARGVNGAGGSVETSGAVVDVGAARIDAGQGGQWLLDPNDLTIDQTAANSIASTLNAGTSVAEATSPSGTGGAGDIIVSPGVTLDWTTNAGLTLSAVRNIQVGANASIGGPSSGPIVLRADSQGSGVGTVIFGAGALITSVSPVTIFYNPTDNPAGSGVNGSSYVTPEDFSATVHAEAFGVSTLTAYMLVNTVADLQNMQNNLAGDYALGANIDASATAGWNGGQGFVPVGTNGAPFTGLFNGENQTISGLTINRPTTDYVGLFGETGSGSTVEDVTVSGAAISGRDRVGVLAGDAQGQVIYSGSTGGSVSGANLVGGLAGFSEDYMGLDGAQGGTVTGTGDYVGGLAGASTGSIFYSASSQTVSGQDYVGGLTGALYGPLTGDEDVATGPFLDLVTSGSVSGRDWVGGDIGDNFGQVMSVLPTGMSVTGDLFVGGVAGANEAQGHIQGSIRNSTVTATGYGGGMVGANFGSLRNAGDPLADDLAVIGTGAGYALGGVAGYNGASGKIDSDEIDGLSVSGGKFGTGGIVGVNKGSVGATFGEEITDAQVSGVSDVGGAVGDNFGVVGNSSQGPSPDLSAVQVGGAVMGANAVGGIVGANEAGGTVQNAAFIGVFTDNASVTGNELVGGVIGANLGSASQLSAFNVTVTGAGPGWAIGGVVGYNGAGANVSGGTGILAEDFTLNLVSVSGGDDVGGGVGINYGTAGLIVQAEYGNTAPTFVYTGSVAGQNYVGGVAGQNFGTLAGSTYQGPVVGDLYVGGVTGSNEQGATISGSFGQAAITANGYAGGVVGVNFGSVQTSTGVLTSVAAPGGGPVWGLGGVAGYNGATGTIVMSPGNYKMTVIAQGEPQQETTYVQDVGFTLSQAATGAPAWTAVGGVVGYNDGSLSAAMATVTFNLSNATQVGGIVGVNGPHGTIGSSVSQGQILEASGGLVGLAGGVAGENLGSITFSESGMDVSGNVDVGGVAGRNDAGATIANAAFSGAVGAGSNLGGLAGENDGQISTSFSQGWVANGTGTSGGVVGLEGSGGTLTNVYWNEATSVRTLGVGSGDGTGATGVGGSSGVDPTNPSTYVGFDFTNTWNPPAAGSPGPTLRLTPY